MDIFNVLLIFLMASSLIPLVRQRMIEATRSRLMREFEQRRGSRLISLIHRQERMSFLGFPMARFIDIQDSEDVLRAIQLTDPKVPIDILLHTPGGLVLAAEQIANALCRREGKVTVFIPHYAMSGGTLIAMAADEIVMDENAVLGPIDPQVGEYPAVSILNGIADKNIDDVDDKTLILADISRKAIRQVKDIIRRLAEQTYGKEQAAFLAEQLASGQWTHDYPICVDEATQLGLKINTNMPAGIYQIMSLFPQSNARRPSVEFIPMPYPSRPALPERRGDPKS